MTRRELLFCLGGFLAGIVPYFVSVLHKSALQTRQEADIERLRSEVKEIKQALGDLPSEYTSPR